MASTGIGGSFFTMLGGKTSSGFSMPEIPKEEQDPEKKKAMKPVADPQEVIKKLGKSIYETRKEEEWEELEMMDGFNKTEQEKLALLYNQIIDNEDLWNPKYKEFYLLAANYSFRALKMSDEVNPSSKERLYDNLEAKRFIVDMNNILDGMLETMNKFLPNANAEFGIMCLFSHSYIGEQIAQELAIEKMKSEIFK
jgi:hypothetical protein